MRHVTSLLLLVLQAPAFPVQTGYAQGGAGQDTLLGFDAAGTAAQRALETDFDSRISTADLDNWLRILSREPHHVGSEAGRQVVDFVARRFREWGYNVEIAEYEVLFPSPRTRELELVAPEYFRASLTEDSLVEDPSTSRIDNLLPPYNAFSIDGEVEGELVFVNYGTPADYEILDRYGISVTGKIAISRYGGSWRGIKPKLAAEKGAVGTIIYSDPADDGYGAGDTYPDGPFKNESAVQRGSVMDMPTYPGDVLTPFVGATAEAPRLPREEAPTITEIPVLPISYRDALPLLQAMGGEVVPAEWRGGLPITYHLGPGPARVRMKLEFNWDMVTAYDVIARLEGAVYPEQWVIRGNHHDGWNHGAADPLSGLVALMGEAKAVAELAAAGSPPARTIVYTAWDSEEQGLIGSTEWVEEHLAELDEKAVAYINTDGNSRGFVNIGGSHVLEKLANQVMNDVTDPQTGVSVAERRRARIEVNGNAEARSELKSRADLRISPLGSGSDYTPFLQHLGVASLNIAFGGEGNDGSYHTLYDTYEHYTRFRDPGMVYGVALAQTAGRATLRLANAPRVPFEFTGLADNIASYVDEIEALAASMREETRQTNARIDSGVYALALDPTHSFGAPLKKAEVPFFNFAPLKNALVELQKAAGAYAEIDQSSAASEGQNILLYTSERELTRPDGLPGRPWFTHQIYAPGFYTGYGVKTLPGVREAIEERQFGIAESEIQTAAGVLRGMAERIRELSE
ncbi:MAG: transferrin receptor-like dimerization domain-containing protein [Gammaproteobacteria bacterium]|nr:M28 family peptidase [Pseudomonadales bacterium]MCP5349280.1 M28 family peptidase [Pseudomonadales bacterium]